LRAKSLIVLLEAVLLEKPTIGLKLLFSGQLRNLILKITSTGIAMKYKNACKTKSNRGGLRNPLGGRPSLPSDQKRPKVSITLAPGTKELAKMIAKELQYRGWGYLIRDILFIYQKKESP